MTQRGRRRVRPPGSTRHTVDGPVILARAPDYVVRWHRVLEWSESVMRGDVSNFETPNRRVAGFRGTMVRDINDEEEAYDEGVPVEHFGDIPDGPNRERGGVRRVSIRLFTWTVNAGRKGAYEPQWITTGWGMSGRAAAHAHGRWIDDYATAVSRGVASRKLIATAMEVVFWTAGPTTDYV